MSPSSRSQRVHELGLKLGALLLVTVVAFFATRTFAAHLRQRTLEEAADLHRLGVADLTAGRVGIALANLRGASTKDRTNPEYGLAYAQALMANGQLAAADRTLRALREQIPDHPVVNLELARVAARTGDEEMALRYYRYALYAPWPTPEGPRRVRDELVRFLLDQRDWTRAVAELVAARATLPDESAAHVHLGELFVEAGDPRNGLEEFQRALQLEPQNQTTRRLAGTAAFQLGDYAAAARFLGAAGDLDAATARALQIARAVTGTDPLTPRIPATERLARVETLIATADALVQSCVQAPEAREQQTTTLRALRQELRRSRGRDTDLLEQAVDRTYQIVQPLTAGCDVSAPPAQALLIIGRRGQEPPS